MLAMIVFEVLPEPAHALDECHDVHPVLAPVRGFYDDDTLVGEFRCHAVTDHLQRKRFVLAAAA